jgi:hypothetical protein
MSGIEKTPEYWRYSAQARNAPGATHDTRVALVSQQLGLSDTDLELFYYVNRKGSKKRYFDYPAFAEKYGISIDWLREGYLPAHPRHLKLLKTVRGTKRRSKNGTPEERAANAAAAKARAASAVEISDRNGDNQRAAVSVARPTWVEFFQYLRTHILREFARGKEIDQIFDEVIASVPADLR